MVLAIETVKAWVHSATCCRGRNADCSVDNLRQEIHGIGQIDAAVIVIVGRRDAIQRVALEHVLKSEDRVGDIST